MSQELSDLHLHVGDLYRSLSFPGPRRIHIEELELAKLLLEQAEQATADDFLVSIGTERWRGRNDRRVVDGQWYRMRKINPPRYLNELPSPLNSDIIQTLMSPRLQRGGLIHICGGPGSGKSTTASATAISRLRSLGGFCSGFEDPPEYDLNGWHGQGYLTQTWVEDWTTALKGALRSQPTGVDLMMYVGEIRDANTAEMMIRAASNGFLVISTGFGSDLISGIDSFKQILKPEIFSSFASVLRVIVHQTLDNKTMRAEMMISQSPSSQVAVAIRNGQLSLLANDIEYQRTARIHGKPITFT